MSATTKIENQINNILPQLTVKQKKAVLTVVKTFMDEQVGYSEDFKIELDKRYKDYQNEENLVSESAAKIRIKKIIQGKAKQ